MFGLSTGFLARDWDIYAMRVSAGKRRGFWVRTRVLLLFILSFISYCLSRTDKFSFPTSFLCCHWVGVPLRVKDRKAGVCIAL